MVKASFLVTSIAHVVTMFDSVWYSKVSGEGEGSVTTKFVDQYCVVYDIERNFTVGFC